MNNVICPRCKRPCLSEDKAMNPISHVGKNIEICIECGKQQGLVGMNYCTDIVEINMESRFRQEIGNTSGEM